MFIVANRNIILPSADGSQSIRVERGFMGNIPDWAAKTPYFNALVKDGKIAVPKSKKDKDIRNAGKGKGEEESKEGASAPKEPGPPAESDQKEE